MRYRPTLTYEWDTKRGKLNSSCSDCGLSLFETEEQARARFANLVKVRPNITKKIGDHLARVALAKAHGVQTNSNEEGHFDLHEYDGVDLARVTALIGPL